MLGRFGGELFQRGGVEDLRFGDGREVAGGALLAFHPAVEAGKLDLFAGGAEDGGRVGTGAALLRVAAGDAAVFRGLVEGHERGLDDGEKGEEVVAGERRDAVRLPGGHEAVVTLDLFVVESAGGERDFFGH